MISTHSAREDGDVFLSMAYSSCKYQFQPTPPARTETESGFLRFLGQLISTHSAREDGDCIYYAA